jgi:hypothetical protein
MHCAYIIENEIILLHYDCYDYNFQITFKKRIFIIKRNNYNSNKIIRKSMKCIYIIILLVILFN